MASVAARDDSSAESSDGGAPRARYQYCEPTECDCAVRLRLVHLDVHAGGPQQSDALSRIEIGWDEAARETCLASLAPGDYVNLTLQMQRAEQSEPRSLCGVVEAILPECAKSGKRRVWMLVPSKRAQVDFPWPCAWEVMVVELMCASAGALSAVIRAVQFSMPLDGQKI